MSCKLHHHFSYCGMLIAVLFSIEVLVAEAAYSFQVTIDRFDNPEEKRNDGSCCDFFCGSCDPRFEDFCLREFAHTRDNTHSCSLGTQNIGVGLGNTITITSTEPWPGSFQIHFQVVDDDDDESAADFVGDVFADSVLSTSTDFVGPVNFRSENGHFTVDLSFRVSCQVDYYGPDCSVFCQGRDDTMGHYHCNETTGDIVCLSGYQNTAIDCTERDGGEDKGGTSPSSPLIGGVVAAGVVIVALSGTVAVLLLCWVVQRRKQLKHVAIARKETLKAYQSSIYSQPYPRIAYGNRTVGEIIPTEENAAYGNRTVGAYETIPTEENAAYNYGNRTVGETIPTEDNI